MPHQLGRQQSSSTMLSKLVPLVIGMLVILVAVPLLHKNVSMNPPVSLNLQTSSSSGWAQNQKNDVAVDEEDKHGLALALVAVPASKDDSPKPKPTPMEENKTNNQQNDAKLSRAHDIALIKYGSPFIIFTEGGCSGTTAIGHYIRSIIAKHGLYRTERVGFEFLHAGQKTPRSHKFKNPYFEDIVRERNMTAEQIVENYYGLILESIQQAQEVAIESSSLLFFKANINKYWELNSIFEALNGDIRYAGIYKKNVLDRCICMVRDCFQEATDFGTAVFGSNGTNTDICLRRRFYDGLDVQANFTDVKGCLRKAQGRVDLVRGRFQSYSTEVLFQFENSMKDQDFEISINAWMDFLKPLLQVALNRNAVAMALEEGRGTRTISSSQESRIYNYDEVKAELEGLNATSFLHT